MHNARPPAARDHTRRPRVSVIVPTRNRAKLLAEAIASAQAQTWTELEILVVDDGSTDETPRYLADAASRDPRVNVFRHHQPKGAAASRNHALAHGTGEFVAFLDDDTRWAPSRLERMVKALERAGPQAGFAYSPYESVEIGGSRVVIGDGPFDDKYRGAWQIGTCGAVVRRDVVEIVGGFDESLPRLQDFDLWIRVLANTEHLFVPELLVRTIRVGGGISTDPDALGRAAEIIAAKYRDDERISSRDRAMIRYTLGHKLLLQNSWAAGLSHLISSVRTRPSHLRAWTSLAAAALGPYPSRLVAKARITSASRRWAGESRAGNAGGA